MTHKKNAWRVLWPWLPTLAMYAVICWFSAQSGEISDAQSAVVRDLFRVQVEWIEALVRKVAHVLLYIGQGAAAAFAWLRCGRCEPKRYGRTVLRAVLLCAALAALDEFHQYFVPGRAALISDVLLDTVSAALGALCVVMIAGRRIDSHKNI
jgi:VanZ family protein